MNIPIDTVNSAMNLAGGSLAFCAAIIAALSAALPKDKAAAAIAYLRERIVDWAAIASSLSSVVAIAAFDSFSWGLIFISICTLLYSWRYLTKRSVATRLETFFLIIQVFLSGFFVVLFFIDRIVGILEKHA